MDNKQIQQELFQQIKLRLPAHLSLVDSVSGLLDISSDSAYRRIRGEKPLDLHETRLLCNHFSISMDNLLGSEGSRVMFTINQPQEEFNFQEYLKGVLKTVQYFHSFTEKKLYYECKDIPLFYHWHTRELAAFKHFFWMKFLFQQKHMKTKKFSFDEYPDEQYDVGRQILHLYTTMPSVEFWNVESINSTIRQIEFLHDTGSFERKQDVAMLYDKVLELLQDLEQTAATGLKKPVFNEDEDITPGSLEFFNNEVILGGNTILAALGPSRMTFLNHTVFNYAVTSDLHFGTYMQHHFENLSRSSTLISRVSELERSVFFNAMRKTLQERVEKLQ